MSETGWYKRVPRSGTAEYIRVTGYNIHETSGCAHEDSGDKFHPARSPPQHSAMDVRLKSRTFRLCMREWLNPFLTFDSPGELVFSRLSWRGESLGPLKRRITKFGNNIVSVKWRHRVNSIRVRMESSFLKIVDDDYWITDLDIISFKKMIVKTLRGVWRENNGRR